MRFHCVVGWAGALHAMVANASAQAPDWEALRLPRAVSVVAMGYNNQDFDAPFDKIAAEIGPDWVRSEQFLRRSGGEWQAYDFTYDTMATSFRFNEASRRAERDARFAGAGISRAEGMITPLGYIRVARRHEQNGGVFTVTQEDGARVYAFVAPPESGLRAVELVIEDGTALVREVRLPSREKPCVARYSDWGELPDGTRHPRVVRFIGHDAAGGVVMDRECRLGSITLLDPARGPSPDSREQSDAAGLASPGAAAMTPLPSSSPSSPAATRTMSAAWLAGIVVAGVIVVAAWMLVLRPFSRAGRATMRR